MRVSRGASKRVLTIGEHELTGTASDLLALVRGGGYEPDVVVGIATGGKVIVDALPQFDTLVRLACRLQRPGTAVKSSLGLGSGRMSRLPYGVTDSIRRFEDRLGERRDIKPARTTDVLEDDIRVICGEVSRRDLRYMVVVDDAVDSGATLTLVLERLREQLPPRVEVRSAVVTVTRALERRIVTPDYALHDGVLCRFPWSSDFRSET